MKTISGNFNNDQLGDGRLTFRLSQDATEIATGAEVFEDIEIQLDENGKIPDGTEILANDELTPGTYYNVTAEGIHGIHYLDYYNESLKIVGTSPINLNELVPIPADEVEKLQKAANPFYNPPAPEPGPVAPPLPAKRVPGANYSGWWGGVVYPAGHGDCMTIEREERYPFYLPFKAVVRQVSILVDVPHPGRGATVTVGLQDVVSGKKVCTTIKASKQGIVTAFFDEAVILNQGEHILSWSADSTALKVRSIAKAGFDGKVVIGPMVYFSA
jgi:uncharacterized protein YuzE